MVNPQPRRTPRRSLRALPLALSALVVALAARAQMAPDETVVFTFHRASVQELAKVVSDLTGATIIFEEKVRQKLSIFSPGPVTPSEAFTLFQTALEAGGQYTLAEDPNLPNTYKVILSRDVKSSALPTITTPDVRPSGASFLTQLVRLKYVKADELSQTLQQLLSRDGLVLAYGPTNTLIITDTATNIRRFMDIIETFDVKESEVSIEVIPLEFAAAEDIADKITQILTDESDASGAAGGGRTPAQIRAARRAAAAAAAAGGTAAGGSEVEVSPGRAAKILPYERTNSIIVVAGKTEIEKIRELVRDLDFDAPPGRASINVVRLQNAQADEIVDVLSALLGGGGGIGSSRRSSSSLRNADRNARNLTGATTTPTALGAGAVSATAGAGEQFSGDVSITADPATNSLVISAAPEDFRILKPVIAELDVRRRQVFVEAVVLEVSLDGSETFGAQISTVQGDGDAVGLIRSTVGPNPIGSVIADPSTAFPLGFGAAITSTDTVEIPGPAGTSLEIPATAVLLQALAASSDVDVLSTPHILTTDNQEAEIIVGQNVPFPTGTVFSQGGVNPVQTIERQDVGLTLRITPHISEGDFVRLEIFQEVSNVLPTASTEVLTQLGPTTSRRSAETTVVVRDRQPVVIGGLIQDRTTLTENKIPYLGDIPYLGWLFSVDTERREKVNLMIMLTPHVIRSPADLIEATTIKREDSEEFYRESGRFNSLEDHLDQKLEQLRRSDARRAAEPSRHEPPEGLDRWDEDLEPSGSTGSAATGRPEAHLAPPAVPERTRSDATGPEPGRVTSRERYQPSWEETASGPAAGLTIEAVEEPPQAAAPRPLAPTRRVQGSEPRGGATTVGSASGIGSAAAMDDARPVRREPPEPKFDDRADDRAETDEPAAAAREEARAAARPEELREELSPSPAPAPPAPAERPAVDVVEAMDIAAAEPDEAMDTPSPASSPAPDETEEPAPAVPLAPTVQAPTPDEVDAVAVHDDQSPTRVAQAYRAGDSVPPAAFEMSPLRLAIRNDADVAPGKVVRVLVWLDRSLIYSRHLESGLFVDGKVLTLFVDGVSPGEHDLRIAMDVIEPDGATRPVGRSRVVELPASEVRTLTAVVRGDARGPRIDWTDPWSPT